MAESCAWLLVLSSVLLCNLLKILLPSFSSLISRLLQKDAEQEFQMRADIQNMKQELSTISMMDEFARYARLERKINKMTDKLKTHVKTRTAQLAKVKWVINIGFYILQLHPPSPPPFQVHTQDQHVRQRENCIGCNKEV
ncbi:tail-anchored protein insertion receptor WRB isoform X2 [Rhinatrema bivittatum]|uniref:tail-anchored protein insertion receptor WRB isoform X2 n=1 Tax=Rhinatrema bivittatum TaxID=194408 RepID=UPI0011264FCB|nr:tail-anchored protein insertion receptor WRB isoform X2 [Rhinatrema bivittatum]